MKIEDIRLGMMVRTKRGKVGKVMEINRSEVVLELSDGEEYGAAFNCIEPETCASRISIEDVRLGMSLVMTGGICGKVVTITKEGGLWLETADRMRFPVHVECVRQIETTFRLGDQVRASGLSYTFRECVDGKIGKIDYLATYGGMKCANVIWADGGENVVPVAQLAKCGECLFDDVLAHWRREYWKPIAEVAKCYKQVEPEQLLLSAEARRVIEYLKARDCPICINNLLGCMENIMSGMAIMDGLIEAREAGIIRLDDGKYSIVRESC